MVMTTDDTPQDVSGWERQLAARILRDAGAPDAVRLRRMLDGLIEGDVWRAFEQARSAPPADPAPDTRNGLDELIPDEVRREHGIFFTPVELAARMAEAVAEDAEGVAVDLSCGGGALLVGLARRRPALELVGVERHPLLAVAAAARLFRAREGAPRAADRIIVGDGLTRRPDLQGARVVIGNPPYVGEKGNRALFRDLRRRHPDLRRYFGPRIDLHYLFVHRALDLLADEGQLIYLTSEYWLAATGAQALRDDLLDRAVVEAFDRLGEGVFDSAPGHHSLVLRARRSDVRNTTLPNVSSGEPWAPFATGPRASGPSLKSYLRDRQGFVSGADRATKSVRKKLSHDVVAGAPVFLWKRDELPVDDRDLFRPLLRRSDCRPNRVLFEPVGDQFVLWADGTEDPTTAARVKALLQPYREALEARREARLGSMPWYRIWWPRNRADYASPKLVVPRRATDGAFCLDLSGSHVSSDCTYLLAREGLDPVPTLLAAMLVLNAPSTTEHLRQYGKTKGEVIEFYSDPLQRLPLAVRDVDGRLEPTDRRLRARWEAACDSVAACDGAAIDV